MNKLTVTLVTTLFLFIPVEAQESERKAAELRAREWMYESPSMVEGIQAGIATGHLEMACAMNSLDLLSWEATVGIIEEYYKFTGKPMVQWLTRKLLQQRGELIGDLCKASVNNHKIIGEPGWGVP